MKCQAERLGFRDQVVYLKVEEIARAFIEGSREVSIEVNINNQS
jgi:hypothetical protein